jgi:hypothetical protein
MITLIVTINMPLLPLKLDPLLLLGGCASLIRATAFHPGQVLFNFFAPFLSGTSLIRPLFSIADMS